jgi:FKBP-type peptidyl-prolyl cis-trans isomerase SlyD
MEQRFLAVHYQLYSVADGERTLLEQTMREKPFQFISGFGVSLEALEQRVVTMPAGTEFDFTLTPAEAFGDYDPEGVHKLSREAFTVDGKFDLQHIYPGAVIAMNDAEGNRILAQVKSVSRNEVVIDTNHPMAGKTLAFTGEMIENRVATDDEVDQLIKRMTGSCGCCGGNCGDGGCDDGGCGEGGCGEGGCKNCHG